MKLLSEQSPWGKLAAILAFAIIVSVIATGFGLILVCFVPPLIWIPIALVVPYPLNWCILVLGIHRAFSTPANRQPTPSHPTAPPAPPRRSARLAQ